MRTSRGQLLVTHRAVVPAAQGEQACALRRQRRRDSCARTCGSAGSETPAPTRTSLTPHEGESPQTTPRDSLAHAALQPPRQKTRGMGATRRLALSRPPQGQRGAGAAAAPSLCSRPTPHASSHPGSGCHSTCPPAHACDQARGRPVRQRAPRRPARSGALGPARSPQPSQSFSLRSARPPRAARTDRTRHARRASGLRRPPPIPRRRAIASRAQPARGGATPIPAVASKHKRALVIICRLRARARSRQVRSFWMGTRGVPAQQGVAHACLRVPRTLPQPIPGDYPT